MKRFLTLLAILLSLSGLAAPLLIGVQTEQRYQEALARLQEQGLTLVREDYRRGWLEAEARSELAYRPAGSGAGRATHIALDSQIRHGPWTPGGGWRLALLETRVRVDGVELSTPLRTRVGFAGCGSTRLAPTDLRFDGGGPRLAGLEGALDFDVVGGAFAGWLQIAELVLPGPGAGSLQELRLDWQLHRGASGVPVGEFGLRLARLALPIGAAEQQPLELVALALRAGLGLQPRGQLMLLELDAELEALNLGPARYGPAQVRLFADNLAPVALGGLGVVLAKASGPGAASPQADRQRAAVLARRVPELLLSDPLIVLERLHFRAPSGSVEASARLQARGLRWPLIGARAWRGLHGEADLRLPAELARALLEAHTRQRLLTARTNRAAAGESQPELDPETFERQLAGVVDFQLKALLNQGLLEPQGGQVEARLRLEDGLLRVNGKELPLALALR